MDSVEIAKLLLDFLEKAGVAIVQTGFPLAVRYIIANAIGNLVQFVLCFVFALVDMAWIKNNWKYADDNSDWGSEGTSWTAFKVIVGVILLIVLLIVASFSSPIESIKMLVAPEWYAILNIVDMVK